MKEKMLSKALIYTTIAWSVVIMQDHERDHNHSIDPEKIILRVAKGILRNKVITGYIKAMGSKDKHLWDWSWITEDTEHESSNTEGYIFKLAYKKILDIIKAGELKNSKKVV